MRSRGFFFTVIAVFLTAHAALTQPPVKTKFEAFVEKQIADHKIRPLKRINDKQSVDRFCPIKESQLAQRVFFEYGAVFAADEVALPPTCAFEDPRDLGEYQAGLRTSVTDIGGSPIKLQEKAMRALLDAVGEASETGLRITPLDGSIAAGRVFDDTVRLWNSRFDRALAFWNRRGAIADDEATAIRFAAYSQQASKVMDWERSGLWFGTDLRKSIFTSVAPPGTSQHLTLLAFDVVEYQDRDVVAMLNRRGWFQTIVGDGPHFTYLGVKAEKLPGRGLRFVYSGSIGYWVPDTSPVNR